MTMSDDKTMTMRGGVGAIVPRTIDEVARLAKMAAESGLAKTTSPQAAGMLICAGLEIGLTPMQALLGMHMVEGRPTLAADTIVALVVRRTDVCEYWRPIESTAERHTIETKRRGPEFQPVRRTWTMDDAKRAGLATKAIWQRYPADMLRHRCATALAREVFPDVIAGMAYTREEIGDGLHNGDDVPEVGLDLTDPTGTTLARPAIDATPAPLALPADNGPSPSQAAATPAKSEALRLAEEQVRGAASVDAVALAYVGARGDLDDAERGRLWRVARGRCADLGAPDAELPAACARHAKPVAPPPDDEPPPDAPKPRSRRSAKPADATGDAAPAANDGAASQAVDRSGARASNGAPLETREQRRAYLATLPFAENVRTSWQRRRDLAGYTEDCAARVQALTGLSTAEALAYLSTPAPAKAAHEPKTRAA